MNPMLFPHQHSLSIGQHTGVWLVGPLKNKMQWYILSAYWTIFQQQPMVATTLSSRCVLQSLACSKGIFLQQQQSCRTHSREHSTCAYCKASQRNLHLSFKLCNSVIYLDQYLNTGVWHWCSLTDTQHLIQRLRAVNMDI